MAGYAWQVPSVLSDRRTASVDAVRTILEQARAAVPAADEAITLTCVRSVAEGWLDAERAQLADHAVSPRDGLGLLLLVASQTTLSDTTAADHYAERLTRFGPYLDECSEQLRTGSSRGRLPVGRLVALVLGQVRQYLAAPEDALLDVLDASVWDAPPAVRHRLAEISTRVVRPAVVRLAACLEGLATRDDDAPGLVHLPGGRDDYEAMVRFHTTLATTAEDIHRLGLEAVRQTQAEMARQAEALGVKDFEGARELVVASGSVLEPAAAMAAAEAAVRRAEASVGHLFPSGPVPPCLVRPMPEVISATGMPPYYTAANEESWREGTFWFNTSVRGLGTGWELEATAFHEAVPGHHTQNVRRLLQTGLPPLQSERSLTAHEEGWALYAEWLALEEGLYSGIESVLGALSMRLMRAARLVVDTRIHHLGWSRARALDWFLGNTAVPGTAAAIEVDRYVGAPGQALAYYTGLARILELRERSRTALGATWSAPGFHAALLDHGAIPLTAVDLAVDGWVRSEALASR